MQRMTPKNRLPCHGVIDPECLALKALSKAFTHKRDRLKRRQNYKKRNVFGVFPRTSADEG